MRTIFIVLFLVVCTIGFAQQSVEKLTDPFRNQVILKHYTVDQLTQLQNTDSIKFNTIVYYYTKTFILIPLECFDCIKPDASKFDVSKFEKYRQQSARYEREFDKYGYKLILLSVDELIYKMPIHSQ